MTKHLKSKQEYIDRYDRMVVEDCRWRENFHKNYKDEEYSDKMPSGIGLISKIALYYDLLLTTVDWYQKKEKVIKEWMNDDERKDNLLEHARPPENIRCLMCRSLTTVTDKILYDIDKDKEYRVLFIYDCLKGCKSRRCFYDNGEEYLIKPVPCPQCQSALKRTSERVEDKKIVTINTCQKCPYTEKDEIDLTVKEETPDPDYEKDRARFCLNEEAAKKPLEEKWRLEQMGRLVESWKEREKHKDIYDAVAKIKKLTIAELQNLLNPIIQKAQYIKFEFGKPEIQRDVVIEFSLQDAKQGRSEYDSKRELQKLINSLLTGTNWHLMSQGVSYRLGFLSGKLRGTEGEENLAKLVKDSETEIKD